MKQNYEEISVEGEFWDKYFLHAASLVDKIEGSFVEVGFGLGTSANIFVKLMNQGSITKRNLWLYDSFEGFPQPSTEDSSPRSPKKGQWKVPIEPALKIKDKIDTSVHVIKGFFEETIPSSYTDGQIAILHLDCDLYNSYKVCLEGLYHKVAPGGLILFDEYKSPKQLRGFPGAAKAIDEFFKNIDIQLVRAIDRESFRKDEESSLQKFFGIKPN